MTDHTDADTAGLWGQVLANRETHGRALQPRQRPAPKRQEPPPVTPQPPELTRIEKRILGYAIELDRANWTRLAQQLEIAARRNATASTDPDGLRSALVDVVVTTSGTSDRTLSAVLTKQQADDLDRYVTDALNALNASHAAWSRLNDRLKLINNLVNVEDLNPPPGCEVLARINQWEPVHRRTEIDGRTWALGKWAYDFHRRVGRLPNRHESEQHAQGKRIRLPA